MSYPKRKRIAGSTISIFEIGKLTWKWSEYVRTGTRLPDGIVPESRIDFPIYNAYITIGQESIIIDPCNYESLCPVGQPLRPEGYTAPLSLLNQLSLEGTTPEKITHVILTHSHLDHCIGSTIKIDEARYAPAFPLAKYYLGGADWDSSETQADLKNAPDVINSLGVLKNYKVLTLIDAETTIAPGVSIVPTPGESPGHQVVRVKSNGSTLYCIGDLFHTPMEIADPQIMATFNEPQTNLKSRTSFLTKATTEDATIFAGHMSLGKIEKTQTGFKWHTL